MALRNGGIDQDFDFDNTTSEYMWCLLVQSWDPRDGSEPIYIWISFNSNSNRGQKNLAVSTGWVYESCSFLLS